MLRLITVLFVVCFIGCKNNKSEINSNSVNKTKVVIAHRGASGYLPEHTLESKAMAYAMGVDYLEQDIVLSKDLVPIVIHDIHLETVTNVKDVFPNKKRADGKYYVIDFTFEELQRLNVCERFNSETKQAVFINRFPLKKSKFKLHSLQDEIELIQGLNKSTGKNIGIYPEIKEPTFHKNEGFDISQIVLDVLSNYGYKTKNDNCILQCFESSELKRIRFELNSKLFLVQLIEFEEDENRIEEFSAYADGIGPWYQQIIKGKDNNNKWIISNLVNKAHENNLKVHAYTFRADKLEGFTTFNELLKVALYDANVDGVFTDFPDKVVNFLNKN